MALDYAAMFKQQLAAAKAKTKTKTKKSSNEQNGVNVPDSTPSSPLLLNDHIVDFKAAKIDEKFEIYYFPEFLSDEGANYIENQIAKKKWCSLPKRKLQNHGGVPYQRGTILEPLPQFLDEVANMLYKRGVFDKKPDQALINEYEAGSGIDFHHDGPNFKPFAADPKSGDIKCSAVLEPNSLLVFKGQTYTELKHGILSNKVDQLATYNIANLHLLKKNYGDTIERKRRISLTMRNVATIQYRMESTSEVLPPWLEEERQRRHTWWRNAIADRDDP